jgi:hypothetical protein
MPKEKEPKAHQLYKQIGPAYFVLNFDSATDVDYSGEGWEVIWNTFPYMVNRQYIDLSGWSRDQLTTFIQGVDFQHSRRPRSTTIGVLEVTMVDILSTRELTDHELTNWGLVVAPGVSEDLPGFMDSTVDLMQVIYGERTTMVSSNTMAPGLAGSVYVTLGGETFGSGNPTAMNRLHWTRVIWANGAGPTETLSIGGTNLIVTALTVEEKDLVWIERLRRSYVQQGEI